MRRHPLLIGLVLVLGATPAATQAPAAPVVIYLHGRIVEEQGPGAVSPEFGAYGYQAILDSLRAGGFQVLADLRPKGTDVAEDADRVARQVDSLLKAGIPPRRIAVVGFSKGGGIAIQSAALLHRTDITFVFLAACSEGSADLQIAGRVLSVFEASALCPGTARHRAPGTANPHRAEARRVLSAPSGVARTGPGLDPPHPFSQAADELRHHGFLAFAR